MILNLSVNPTWMQSLAFVMMNYGQSPAQVVLDAMKSDKSLEVTPNSVTLHLLEIVTTFLRFYLIKLHPGLAGLDFSLLYAGTLPLVCLLETVSGLLWFDLLLLHPGLASPVFSSLPAEPVLLVPVLGIVATFLWLGLGSLRPEHE